MFSSTRLTHITKIDSPGDCGLFDFANGVSWRQPKRQTAEYDCSFCVDWEMMFFKYIFYFLLFMMVNALHLANIQLTKGFLPWIIRSTCVAQMTVSECNQPQGTD